MEPLGANGGERRSASRCESVMVGAARPSSRSRLRSPEANRLQRFVARGSRAFPPASTVRAWRVPRRAPVEGGVDGDDSLHSTSRIAADAAPGRYSGELAVGQGSIPVSLEVMRARIDRAEPAEMGVLFTTRDRAGARFARRRRARADRPRACYHDLFRAHGVLLASDWPPARFVARRSFVHDVRFWPVAVDTSSDAAIAHDVRR